MNNYGCHLRTRESGFSAIEMLVVMVIIAIAAGIAIPTFSVWLPNSRLKSAAQDLYSNMQRTKIEAIKRNTSQSITFAPMAGTYTKFDGTTVVNLSQDYGTNITFGKGDAPSGVSGSGIDDGVTYTSDTLTFTARGLGSDGWVYIQNDKNTSYAIGTLTSGVIRLKKWNGSDWE